MKDKEKYLIKLMASNMGNALVEDIEGIIAHLKDATQIPSDGKAEIHLEAVKLSVFEFEKYIKKLKRLIPLKKGEKQKNTYE